MTNLNDMYGNRWLGYKHLYWSPFYTSEIKYNLRYLTLTYVPHKHIMNKFSKCRICDFPLADCP